MITPELLGAAGSATMPLLIGAVVLLLLGATLLLGSRTRRSKRGRHASGGIRASEIGEVYTTEELRGRDSNSQPSG